MKRFLLLLIALLMVTSAYAASYLYIDGADITVTKDDIRNGTEFAIPVRASFAARVSGWDFEITNLPAGITFTFAEKGADFDVTLKNGRGRDQVVSATLYGAEEPYMHMLATQGEVGYWQDPNSETPNAWVSYGVAKWEGGEYEEMLLMYAVFDENYHGGVIETLTSVASGSDARGGTVVEQGDHSLFFSHDSGWLEDPNPVTVEKTEKPVITTEEVENGVKVIATGNGHVCLYIEDILCAEGEDFAQYIISRTENDEEYNVSATAQEDGKDISDYALATVYVPAIQITEKLDVPAPVIETSMDDDNVYVTIIWPETDGYQVYTGEYTYSRTYEDQTYEVEAYTTETEIYKESEHAFATILVPAKESPSTGDIVFVAGIDNGTSDGTAGAFSIEKEGVKIEVSQGLANASHYRIYKNQTLKITSTVGAITKVTFDCVAPGDAQYGPVGFSAEPGDYTYYDYVGTWSGESESITFTAVNYQVRATRISVTLSQSGQITPMPEITTSMTDNSVVVTAVGAGHVCLYFDDMLFAEGEDYAEYVISRTEYDQEYNVSATAQADGMEVSEYALATVYVPAIQIAEKLDVPAPVIETSMDDNYVYVGIIWPESDGDQVYAGEYTYIRPEYGNPDESYVVEAYTTETETYKESEHATATILVPAKEGQEEDKATGEYGTQADGSPAKVGQCVTDHLFARNEYIDANGQHFVVDNAVSFKDNETQSVWFWLDDDQIYLNEAVQALTPIAYNSAGDLYNEITYNSCQFNIYLPSSVSLTKTETNKMAIWGDRLPSTSEVYWAKKNDTKIIDGIEYVVYLVVIYNLDNYGSHFSGKDATMYEQLGALKKDDAPLFGLYLEYDNSSSGEIPDMIIANVEFSTHEAYIAGWEPNESMFFYGTGGNNVEQRFQLYNRVKLTEGDLEPVSHITPAPEITTSMTDNSVVVTATGEGEVKLYINGVAVSNPYTINRGTEDKTYTATATAQADGMYISETARATIEVPKMDGDGSFLYINDYQIPTSKLGGEIVLPLRAHFDARVSGWLVEMTFPEGITPVYCEAGGAITVTYLDSRGTQQTTKASFTPGPTNTNILSYFGTAGFWMPEGATEYESYGVVKWEAGDYGEMALIYCEVDPDFTGGQLIVNSDPSSGNDTRGGTTAPGQHHTYTTNITIGGQELAGEILIGDCDANGKVPVTYTGDEDVTLDVMVDGQSVPVIDGMVQLKHYGRTIVSAEATAIGYAPLHANAEVNWASINNGDWEILKAFYNQYKNDVLVWDMSDRNKPGSCPGVSSENGRVTAITLPDHELEGGFPTMLLGLDKLTVLDLSYNNLSGDAAADMAQYAAANGIKAKGLLELYIHHNDFMGNVGALAALFSNLETLNVSNNHFAQVYPMVNPAVNLSLSNQLLEMDGDITGGLASLALSFPTICLYDHAGQSFGNGGLEITLTNNHQTPKWYMNMYVYDGDYWLEGTSSEPYRGANGETLDGNTYLYNDNEDNQQQLQVKFLFNMGDANFNGPVDITDLQAMVNYIFGEYVRMFNFTAANHNNDAMINVQDVVGEANLLLSMELTMTAPALNRAPAMDEAMTEAYLYWEDGTLYLNTAVPVTALDIVNDAEGDITWNVANLGFVVKNATSAQGAHAVIYSLGDAVIEPGVTAIATTNGRMPSVVAAKLSNADAELVEVRLNDRMTGLKNLTEDGKPQCHINGTNLVISNGTDLNDVDIDIYTIDGKLVWGKHVNRLENGNTSFDLSDISGSHRYYIIVVRNGRQIIATQKLTQIR